MATIAVEHLEAQLSAAIARVEAGETLVITRDNITIAQLVPTRLAHTHRGSRVGTGRLQPAIKGGLAGAKGRSLATLSDDRGDR